ncbi:MAG: glycoside hydrolase family 26 protein [Solirubrobacterales bacterium]
MSSAPSRHKHLLAILVAALAAVAVLGIGIESAQAHSGRQRVAPRVALTGSLRVPAERTKPHASPAGRQIYVGATVGGAVYGETSNPPWNMRPLETFEAHSGRSVAILQVHQDWGSIYPDVLRRIRAHGAVPMLVTEYENLNGVVNGSQDRAIRAMNAALSAYGGPVLFRWNWEMNGDWYEWGGLGQAKQWVAAYRHIHDLITAPNVSWIWNPNVYDPGSRPGPGVPANPTPWYPGDDYVDWMGADGYSYDTETFSEVFGPTYRLFQELAPGKPIILPEWAASNKAGRKAAYISEAFAQVPAAFPAIKAMVYYNDTLGSGKEWPLETSPAAESAYRLGSAQPPFTATPNSAGKLAVP